MLDYLRHGILKRPYRLHISRSGDRSKPVIILLHGIAASGDDWRKVLPRLEPNYYCITIDLMGFGESPKPQWLGYTMDDHMRALYYTIDKLRMRKPFVLVGHSLGALLAARYARKYEKNLKRLLLLSPPVYPPLYTIKKRSTRRFTGLLLGIYKFLRDDPRITPDTFRRLMYIAPLPRTIVQKPDTWIPFMRTLKECIEQQTIIQDVKALTVPIDVCYGTLDQVVLAANIQLLGENPQVTLHKFMNTHDLTARYGRLVAGIIEQS